MAAPAAPAEIITCPNCGRRNRGPAAATGLPRCGNCHQPLPWIADAADDTFAEVAEAPKIQQRFDVQAIPTLMVLRRGQVAARRAGAAPAADLRKWVQAAIAP